MREEIFWKTPFGGVKLSLSYLLEELDPGGLLDFRNRKFPMNISFLIDLHSHRSMGILK
jgi:hypothetical protein